MKTKKLLTGNEAIARGAYEAGIVFAAAYPGAPSTEILENMGVYKEDIIAEWAPNEKVALESAIGASIAGVRSLSAMNHAGVNIAADPLFSFAYTGVTGGMVLVVAGEPGMHSSKNVQDNRNYAKFAKVALLEPSDSQEAKDMVMSAVEISEKYDSPVILRMSSRICHSKSIVELGERMEALRVPYVKNVNKYDQLSGVSRVLRQKVEQRLINLKAYSNETPMNCIEWNDRKIGIVTSGISYLHAKEVFGSTASYLKLGFTFPLPFKKIENFAKRVETLYVIEELEPFIEEQLKAKGIDCIGRNLLSDQGGFNPDLIAKSFLNQDHETIDCDASDLPTRQSTLCAGCPHRGFFYELAKKKNIMICGDIGCSGLSNSSPLNAKDTSICMGASVSMAHGAQKIFNRYNDKMRAVAAIGDSAFFHTGVNSLLDIIYNHSNSITCILDNRTAGMSGQQDHPGSGYTLEGSSSLAIDIPNMVRAMGVKHVRVVNPNNLKEMSETIDWALAIKKEPSVIITRWPCALKKYSQMDLDEFGPIDSKCVVDQEKCIGCKMCIKTGCPALIFDAVTRRVDIDSLQCVGCEICLQICPVDAIEKAGVKND